MNNRKTTSNTLPPDYDTTISLLGVYLAEWSHREQILWAQIFRFYYAILIVILLPNVADYLKIELPSIPIFIFRLIGLFLSVVFLYVSSGYAIRLQAIGNTYQSIINRFPKEFQRESIKDIKYKEIAIGKIFVPRLVYVICFSLFISLFSLAIILIII